MFSCGSQAESMSLAASYAHAWLTCFLFPTYCEKQLVHPNCQAYRIVDLCFNADISSLDASTTITSQCGDG
eukprot:1155423-Pelagomonas_calceolata.AAC.3